MTQAVKTLRVVEGAEPGRYTPAEHVVLVDAAGEPIDLGGGGEITIGAVGGLQAALDDKASTDALEALSDRVAALEDGGGD